MSEIKALREKMANIATEARSKLNEIDDNTPAERAAEIEGEFDAMMAEHDKLGDRAERMSKLEKAEKRAADYAEDVNTGRRPGGKAEAKGEDDGEPMSYRSAFHEYIRAEGNVAAMSGEARSVLRAGYTEIGKEERAQVTTTDSAGGFTVPVELQNILIRSMLAWGPMYDENIATSITTTGGYTMTMPTVNDTAVTPEAHTEGASLTDDGGKDVTFGEKQLDAYAWNTEWLRVSKELADDSIFAMESLLGDLLGERLGRIANAQLTTGTGSSAPHGIATASSLGTTATGTAAITADEIIDLVHSVDPAYRVGPKVGFMFNDATLAHVYKLKDGQGNYLWSMGDVQAGVPGTIRGYRYTINQAMPSLAAGQRAMLFGDFGKYYVRKVGEPLVAAMGDKDFWPGFGVAGYIRFDGELGDTAAVKHLITAAS